MQFSCPRLWKPTEADKRRHCYKLIFFIMHQKQYNLVGVGSFLCSASDIPAGRKSITLNDVILLYADIFIVFNFGCYYNVSTC